ncbi:MAG: hypothetical protein GXY36_01675 [Chloroflexi bacterium]|jgi:hypothetical protein|nr:hypothetical protein [Chloroflexota bacterium]
MAENPENRKQGERIEGKKRRNQQGLWLALGISVGAAMFSITSSPVYIGVGLAVGLALGAVLSRR